MLLLNIEGNKDKLAEVATRFNKELTNHVFHPGVAPQFEAYGVRIPTPKILETLEIPPTLVIYYYVYDARQCPLGHVLRTASVSVSMCIAFFVLRHSLSQSSMLATIASPKMYFIHREAESITGSG